MAKNLAFRLILSNFFSKMVVWSLRLVPMSESVSDKDCDSHLSFWNPDASLRQLLKEGARIRMYNVTASRSKYVT